MADGPIMPAGFQATCATTTVHMPGYQAGRGRAALDAWAKALPLPCEWVLFSADSLAVASLSRKSGHLSDEGSMLADRRVTSADVFGVLDCDEALTPTSFHIAEDDDDGEVNLQGLSRALNNLDRALSGADAADFAHLLGDSTKEESREQLWESHCTDSWAEHDGAQVSSGAISPIPCEPHVSSGAVSPIACEPEQDIVLDCGEETIGISVEEAQDDLEREVPLSETKFELEVLLSDAPLGILTFRLCQDLETVCSEFLAEHKLRDIFRAPLETHLEIMVHMDKRKDLLDITDLL